MSETIKTIGQYFNGPKKFVIPNYQRGYKWGVPDKEGNSAVDILMKNLINAFKNNVTEYYIQGVTVYENQEGTAIYLIDGQQRTTTFFLLLKYLKHEPLPEIDYEVRETSKYVLNSSTINEGELFFEEKENSEYDVQDIFYFQKAIKTIHEKIGSDKGIKNDQLDKFKDFILNKVKLFYIIISPNEATKVFSMVNAQKAIMKTDELIKSALLSKASRANKHPNPQNSGNNDLNELLQIIKNKVGEEWEINTLRSKYAREWDKWLYWWNREDVKKFYGSGDNPLGLLLEYYFEIKKGEKNKKKRYSYENFSKLLFQKRQETKLHFKGIRDLQKTFEDWFNDFEKFNYLGLIRQARKGNHKQDLLFFLKNEHSISFKEYAKWALIGASYEQIVNTPTKDKQEEIKETKETKAENVYYNMLMKPYVYWDENDAEFSDGRKELAYLQLLRMNVEMDNKLERKFKFEICYEKSLEHIFPKSKKEELIISDGNSDELSVHCIGNLVILSKNNNSRFSNKNFHEKKDIFFNENVIDSMSLLHSLSVFSKNEWKEKEIKENKEMFSKNYLETYSININVKTNE